MSPEDLLKVEVRWSFDPSRVFWYLCEVEGHCFALRLNAFPDENLYSLDRGDGTFLELEEIPAQWTLNYPPGKSDGLIGVVKARFPELRERVEEEEGWWHPDPVGLDILLADLFVPFFVDAMRGRPESWPVVHRAAAFVEELARSTDEDMHEVVVVSVLQALEDHAHQLGDWVDELGLASRALLPTRDADGRTHFTYRQEVIDQFPGLFDNEWRAHWGLDLL